MGDTQSGAVMQFPENCRCCQTWCQGNSGCFLHLREMVSGPFRREEDLQSTAAHHSGFLRRNGKLTDDDEARQTEPC